MNRSESPNPRTHVEAAPVGDAPGDGRLVHPPAARRDETDRRDDSLGAFFRELPALVLVAFVLAFLLRTFVVQVFYIPSSSMEPTLLVNDRILVDKVSYRFRDLRRGEVVVFEGADAGLTEPNRGVVERVLRGFGQLVGVTPANARDFVKRVIGLPGDEIRIEDGKVFVNDVPLDEPYAVDDPRSCEPILVPEGQLFFLGDNRPNSSDSRYPSLGFVDRDAVVGKAFTIIWPLDRLSLLRGADYPQIPEPRRAPPASDQGLPAAPCVG
ncbi:MAG TPA: signal peptidase I [Nitriliruptorales bacterium]|nr:signal peptidase I [Nitriliruptorales bacterium]